MLDASATEFRCPWAALLMEMLTSLSQVAFVTILFDSTLFLDIEFISLIFKPHLLAGDPQICICSLCFSWCQRPVSPTAYGTAPPGSPMGTGNPTYPKPNSSSSPLLPALSSYNSYADLSHLPPPLPSHCHHFGSGLQHLLLG